MAGRPALFSRSTSVILDPELKWYTTRLGIGIPGPGPEGATREQGVQHKGSLNWLPVGNQMITRSSHACEYEQFT